MNFPTVVYLEAVLMDNGEIIHYGKSLGFVSKKQKELVEAEATKLTKGSVPVVALNGNVA